MTTTVRVSARSGLLHVYNQLYVVRSCECDYEVSSAIPEFKKAVKRNYVRKKTEPI